MTNHIRSLSKYIRERQEQQTSRRLGVAKALRDTPDATNVELAKVFGVNRDTIAEDRKALMEQLVKNTLTETEQMRAEMLQELVDLKDEVEKHRKDGKLSLQAIDRMLDISKAIIELTGVRKPVNEKLQVTHRAPIRFETVIVGSDGKETRPTPIVDAEVIHELGEGK